MKKASLKKGKCEFLAFFFSGLLFSNVCKSIHITKEQQQHVHFLDPLQTQQCVCHHDFQILYIKIADFDKDHGGSHVKEMSFFFIQFQNSPK